LLANTPAGWFGKQACNPQPLIRLSACRLIHKRSQHQGKGNDIFFKGLGSTVKNYTLLAGLLSLVLLLLFYNWFRPGLLPLAGYLVVALLAFLSVPVLYRLFGYSRADESRWLAEREEQEYQDLTRRLKDAREQLSKLGIKEGVEQSEQLTNLVEDYHSVVETRFIGKKHMPLEYLGAARQVQKQAVQNLSDMVTVGHSMATIDSNTFESAAVDDRVSRQGEMYQGQAARVRSLLDENYQMFDALTDTAVEVANIDSFSK